MMKKLHEWLLKDENFGYLYPLPLITFMICVLIASKIYISTYLMIYLMIASLIPSLFYVYYLKQKSKPLGLDTRLLKKMRENWTIIKYNDPLAFTGPNDIYRALYRGKLIKCAWDLDKSQVLLLIAYASKYGNNSIFDSTYSTPIENVKAYRYERKKERQEKRRQHLIKTLKPVWP